MSFQIHDSIRVIQCPGTLAFARSVIVIVAFSCGWSNLAAGQPPKQKSPLSTVKAVIQEDPIPLFGDKVSQSLNPKLFYSAALSMDDRWIAGGIGDWTTSGEILLWDAANRQQVFRHTLGRGIRSLAFSPDGKLLAAGSFTNELLIVEVPSGAIVARWMPHTAAVNGLAFSRDGKLLASVSLDKTVKLWATTRPTDPVQGLQAVATLEGHSDWVFTVAFSHDGKTLFSGGREAGLFVWDVENNRQQAVWNDVSAGVESIAVSRDGDVVAVGLWDGSVELRKAADGALASKLEHLPKGERTVCMVSFSNDGKSMASSAFDGTVKIWDFPSGELRTTIRAHSSRAWGALLTSDASQLFTAGGDGHLRLWDVKTQKRVYQFPEDLAPTETTNPITAVAWPSDPSLTLTAHSDRSVRLRSTITGKTMQMVVAPSTIISLAISPDGLSAIGGGQDKMVFLFDLQLSNSGMLKSPVPLKAHTTEVSSVVFSSDGRQAYSAGYDGLIQQWDVTTRTAGRVLDTDKAAIQSLARSNDGQWLAAGDVNGSVQLWDLLKGDPKPVAYLKGHTGPVTGLAFASQAAVLASGGSDQKVLVWNLADLKADKSGNSGTGLQPVKLLGHSAMVTRLALSSQGIWLATGGEDKTVRIWDTRTASMWKVVANPSSSRGLFFDSRLLINVRTDRFLDSWQLKTGQGFPKVSGRYVKLRALSAIQPGDPFASAAEIELFQSSQPIAKAGWKVASVDSENKGNEGALAFDGDPATFWHTKWQTDKPTLQPHELVIDLGRSYGMTGLFVLSRSDDSRNGTIRDFELYISNDAKNFGKPVIKGELNPPVPPKR